MAYAILSALSTKSGRVRNNVKPMRTRVTQPSINMINTCQMALDHSRLIILVGLNTIISRNLVWCADLSTTNSRAKWHCSFLRVSPNGWRVVNVSQRYIHLFWLMILRLDIVFFVLSVSSSVNPPISHLGKLFLNNGWDFLCLRKLLSDQSSGGIGCDTKWEFK